ncbi:uncharacterized protein EV420DRAFT_1271151, partial [Desarmillaria tabescens]
FPIAVFDHCHETHLIPDILEQAYGKHFTTNCCPSATFSDRKQEVHRGSEYAPHILTDHGLYVTARVGHSSQ